MSDTTPSDNVSQTTHLSEDTFDLNTLDLASEDDLLPLSAAEIPVPDALAVADLSGDVWSGVWEAISKADSNEALFSDSHSADDPAVANQHTLDADAPPAPKSVIPLQKAQTRGAIAVIGVAVAAVAAVSSIVKWIIDQNWSDHQRRSEFTQTIVRQLRQRDSSFNYVICSTRHEIRPQGRPGHDFAREAVPLPIWWGLGSVRYTVYSFRAGVFRLLGDGGYLNWAYYGNVVSDTGGRQPRTVVFRDPRGY
ncbi:hypothetical protein CYLTODRAFT_423175 [Cylindrobasidium torrendii FP15055 ss-10]|uniref:Uncharacterized protein n=1 Tax=Cylindrobasidium torrendii FP15055 ss-10 TaxID=1314674 RepID=A0A0D7B841_9AGAR|nr:hypothetical protein CYLTODRAFT_423175 [Cylindrobasidium torrendii FP15055 ss-10]